jgi:hypothetical protein
MIAQPAGVFLGYQLKRLAWPEGYSHGEVEWVASASHCVNEKGLGDGKYKDWLFNDSGYFDSPELAMSEHPGSGDWEVLAFAYFSWLFDTAEVRKHTVTEQFGPDAVKLPSTVKEGFSFIGFDVVSIRSYSHTEGFAPQMGNFDCSPLSCNYCWKQHPVNRYCLLDRWEDAVVAAEAFAKDEPEPGPYVIVGVYRRTT